MLGALNIKTVGDLETRRISGRRTMEQLLAVKSAIPNSDYFPVVDTDAARARFKAERADAVFNLASIPLPLVDLFERHAWIGTEWPTDAGAYEAVGLPWLSGKAAGAVRNLTETLVTGKASTPMPPEVAVSAAALQALFVDCVSPPAPRGLMDPALTFATLVDRTLPPARGVAFWDLLAARPCAPGDADRRLWLAQFRAVAQRDPATVASTSVALLAEPRSAQQTEYLLLAAYAGLRADNRLADADALRAQWSARVPPEMLATPAFRAIEALSPIVAAKD
jgi:hypothetical protein